MAVMRGNNMGKMSKAACAAKLGSGVKAHYCAYPKGHFGPHRCTKTGCQVEWSKKGVQGALKYVVCLSCDKSLKRLGEATQVETRNEQGHIARWWVCKDVEGCGERVRKYLERKAKENK